MGTAMVMQRQQSSADIAAYHGRSLGAGPPESHLTLLRSMFDDVVALATRRSSNGPPAPRERCSGEHDSDAPASGDDEGDSDPLG